MPENFLSVCSTPPPLRHSPLAFSTQELNCVSDPGIEPGSPTLQADSLSTELPGKPCVFLRRSLEGKMKNFSGGKAKKQDRTHKLEFHFSVTLMDVQRGQAVGQESLDPVSSVCIRGPSASEPAASLGGLAPALQGPQRDTVPTTQNFHLFPASPFRPETMCFLWVEKSL